VPPLKDLDLRAPARLLAVLAPVSLVVSAQEFVVSAVALLFLAHCARERDFSMLRAPWFVAFATLWAYTLIRTLVGHPTGTGVVMALGWIRLPIFAMALAQWVLPDEATRRRLLLATIGVLAFFSADILLQAALGRDIIGRAPFRGAFSARMTSVFGKPGVGLEIAWLLPPALLGLLDLGWRWRAAGFGALCVVAILLSGDRMGLITVLGECILAVLFIPRARMALLLGGPIALALAVILLALDHALYTREVDSTVRALSDVSASDYGAIWGSAAKVVRDYPAFGVGFHNFEAVCADPRYGPPLIGAFPRCSGHPHNIWLQWQVETGAIGLALYVTAAALSLIEPLRRRPSRDGALLTAGLIIALAMRFSPFATSTSFLSSWSSAPMFLILGWALAATAARPQPPPPE
jgi:O-antigen ligase